MNIRKMMDLVEGFSLLSEAPERIPSSDFNLENDVINRAFCAKHMSKVAEVVRTGQDYRLVRTGDGRQGWFILYNEITGLTDYVVQYRLRQWNWLPATVTQCLLWRRTGSAINQGITSDVFFNILLPRYNAIMSDRQQTDAGHNFWIDRMASAASRGMTVGLVDMNQKSITNFSGHHSSVTNWIKQQDAFNHGHRYQALRYLIIQ